MRLRKRLDGVRALRPLPLDTEFQKCGVLNDHGPFAMSRIASGWTSTRRELCSTAMRRDENLSDARNPMNDWCVDRPLVRSNRRLR
jgi:hypothetical protein